MPDVVGGASRRHRDGRPGDRQRVGGRQPSGGHRGAPLGAAHREPDERVPFAGVEPGRPRDVGTVHPVVEPRRGMVVGHARRLRRGGARCIRAPGSWGRASSTPTAPSTPAGGRSPACSTPWATPSSARSPRQPLHAPLPAGGLGPHDRARGGLGERRLHADAARPRSRRWVRSTRRSPSTARSSTWRRVCGRRAGRCGSRPSPRSSTRSACRRGGRAARCAMHSSSIYRYYRKHRARGWRRLTLPFAWAVLRLRAELEWLRGKVARVRGPR